MFLHEEVSWDKKMPQSSEFQQSCLIQIQPLLAMLKVFCHLYVLHYIILYSCTSHSQYCVHTRCVLPLSGVLCKSLDGGVLLGHWNHYSVLDQDQLDFVTLFLTRHQKPQSYPRLDISLADHYHYHSPTYADSIFQQRCQFVRICNSVYVKFSLQCFNSV